MSQIAWDLTNEGCSLRILKVDPLTRRAVVLLELMRKEPMTEAEAQKYIDANYPNKGAVRAAAEILSMLRED
jgi:hypothetical protein